MDAVFGMLDVCKKRFVIKQKNEKNSYKLMQRVNLDRFILQKEKFDFIFLEKKKIINIED